MKYIRLPKLVALILITLASAFATSTAQAEKLTVNAILILGSNDNGGIDSSLQKYAKNLTQHFRFDTFKQYSTSRASVPVPGSNIIGMAEEHSVSIKVDSATDGKYRISAQWKRGPQTIVNTTVVASKNRETVLVGPSNDGKRLILLLVAN